MTDRRHLVLWALFVLQALCTVFFAADATLDARAPDKTDGHGIDTFEYAVAFVLALSTIFTGFELRKLVRRDKRLTQQLRAASGAFAEVLENRFDEWNLTDAEREVALLAIKGFSVAEVAAMRDTKEGTTKAQNAAIYRKAGVSGRLQLLSLFIDDLMDEGLMSDRAAP